MLNQVCTEGRELYLKVEADENFANQLAKLVDAIRWNQQVGFGVYEYHWEKNLLRVIMRKGPTLAEIEVQGKLLDNPIESLELTTRTYNVLRNLRACTLRDVVRMTEPELLEKLGPKRLVELKYALGNYRLSPGMIA